MTRSKQKEKEKEHGFVGQFAHERTRPQTLRRSPHLFVLDDKQRNLLWSAAELDTLFRDPQSFAAHMSHIQTFLKDYAWPWGLMNGLTDDQALKAGAEITADIHDRLRKIRNGEAKDVLAYADNLYNVLTAHSVHSIREIVLWSKRTLLLLNARLSRPKPDQLRPEGTIGTLSDSPMSKGHDVSTPVGRLPARTSYVGSRVSCGQPVSVKRMIDNANESDLSERINDRGIESNGSENDQSLDSSWPVVRLPPSTSSVCKRVSPGRHAGVQKAKYEVQPKAAPASMHDRVFEINDSESGQDTNQAHTPAAADALALVPFKRDRSPNRLDDGSHHAKKTCRHPLTRGPRAVEGLRAASTSSRPLAASSPKLQVYDLGRRVAMNNMFTSDMLQNRRPSGHIVKTQAALYSFSEACGLDSTDIM